MNANHEQSAEKKALVDTLLAIDSRMPTSSAEAREVAKEVLRRDRRRVRILTWATSGLFLLTVIGICLSAYWYYIKVMPEMNGLRKGIPAMYSDISKLEPQSSKPDPLARIAMLAVEQCHILYMILLVTVWGILVLLAIMLVAAVCTVLLIRATRGATLRQIQASLLALSEQFNALQQSLQGGQPSGSGQAMKQSNR
jgi:fatty acid desaturase